MDFEEFDFSTNISPKYTKSITYKGESFPIDYDLLKRNSIYFQNNCEKNDYQTDIPLLVEEQSDFPIPYIQEFINFCHNQKIKINPSNIFYLHYLAKIYQVQQLENATLDTISKYKSELSLESLLFIIQMNTNTTFLPTETTTEEQIVSEKFSQYIEDERLYQIPIPILYRIVHQFQSKINDQETREKFNEFLFKLLDRKGEKASMFFEFFDIEKNRTKDLIKLHEFYSDIFNPYFLNESLLATTVESIKNYSIMKEEISNQFKEMKEYYEEQFTEIKADFSKQQEELSNECTHFSILAKENEQKMEEQKKYINELKEQISTLKQQNKNSQQEINEIKNQIKNHQQKIEPLAIQTKKEPELSKTIKTFFDTCSSFDSSDKILPFNNKTSQTGIISTQKTTTKKRKLKKLKQIEPNSEYKGNRTYAVPPRKIDPRNTDELVCTNCLLNSMPATQPMYQCRDCGIGGNSYICQNCAIRCHHKHKLIYYEQVKEATCECYQHGHCLINPNPALCTFATNGKNYIMQKWYHCETCGLVGNLGCCEICARTCHRGHRVTYDGVSPGCFCDCGAGKFGLHCRNLQITDDP